MGAKRQEQDIFLLAVLPVSESGTVGSAHQNAARKAGRPFTAAHSAHPSFRTVISTFMTPFKHIPERIKNLR
jgi:hypothetical protein